MKKLIAIILTIAILIPCIVIAEEKALFAVPEKKVTYEQAHQFADELKVLKGNADYRLIVSTDKKIDYQNASATATGIKGLYVLQYDTLEEARKAEEYYNSLPYVNYIEYDVEQENIVCSVDDNFGFVPNCASTVNNNIDDAIKLIHQGNIKLPEMKIAVIDSGIAKTSFTKNRMLDGYSYLDGFAENGTQDNQGHGSKVAGTIIQNTLDNVKVVPYQVFSKDTSMNGTFSYCVSAIYLSVSEGCSIINCSFIYKTAKSTEQNSIKDAIDYATRQGVLVIAGAGNDSVDLSTINGYPARVENVITVGAVNQTKRLATFSNYGTGVDIYATGFGMLSYDQNGNKFDNWSGTSAATPVISSICALLLQVKPNITVDEVKQLLIETGYSTNEDNQTDEHRLIADAYGCIKKLLNAELEQVSLDYTIIKNDTTNCSDISFSSDDKNIRIYYELGLGSFPETPFKQVTGACQYEYNLGDTIKLSKWQNITVAAYAPGKQKNVLIFSAPMYNSESGYRLTLSSSSRQYNMIDRCQIVDEEIIEVPETINGVEVQEIGDWCFVGNKAVETIILPDTVKQIGKYAFAYCPNLKTVIAPGVESCGIYAFYNSTNLKTVIMPNVTVANTGMFKNCCSLSNLEIGTLDTICNQAFYCCENLQFINVSDEVDSFSYNTFDNCPSLTVNAQADSYMFSFASSHNIPIGDLSYLRYDFVEDGYINSKDFSILIRNINGYENDITHNYDLNNDGTADEADAQHFKSYFQNHYTELSLLHK